MKSALTIIITALVMLPYPIFAAENVLGDWEFEFKKETKIVLPPLSGTLTIARNADGSYSGKIILSQKGESPLYKIGFKNNRIYFLYDEVVANVKMEATNRCRAAVKGTKMIGAGNGPLGRFDLEGTLEGQPKAGPDAFVGTWKINITDARAYKDMLTIFKNPDGSLGAKWDYELDKFRRITSDVNFTDPDLSFRDRTEYKKYAITGSFKGVVKGDTITGTLMDNHNKTTPMKANRVVPDKEDQPNKADPNR